MWRQDDDPSFLQSFFSPSNSSDANLGAQQMAPFSTDASNRNDPAFRNLHGGFETPRRWIRTICRHVADVLGARLQVSPPSFMSVSRLWRWVVGLVIFCCVTQETCCCTCQHADMINHISPKVPSQPGSVEPFPPDQLNRVAASVSVDHSDVPIRSV